MRRRRTLAPFAALALLSSCAVFEPPSPPVPVTRPTSPAAASPATEVTAVPGGRTLTPAQRTAILEVLRSERGEVRRAWIHTPGGALQSDEAIAFVGEIDRVFREAGWQTQVGQSAATVAVAPGIHFLSADDEVPSFVATALRALVSSGL